MPTGRKTTWLVCIWLVVLIIVVIYSPLVLRAGVTEPWIFGLPFTLWATLLGAFSIVIITAIAAYWRPSQDESGNFSEHKPLKQ
ncbi:MAG: hypothetical protein ACU84Q_19935 [Gammaproteobacteria bacterium]